MKYWFCVFLLLAAPAAALDLPLENPAQEAQARELFTRFRCVVCQSESLAESPADVAKAIRSEIRGRIAAGESDEQISDYLVSQYGEFILMKPVFAPHTYALWLAPICILLIGGGCAFTYFRIGQA